MDKMHKNVIKKASIQIDNVQEKLYIKSKFNFANKSNIGVLLYLLMSLFILAIVILKSNDWIELLLGVLLGGSVLIFSIVTILKQISDFVEITSTEIHFRNSLNKHKYPLRSNMHVKMEAETVYTKMNSQVGSGSYFRIIELYLEFEDSKYRIFDFQVDERYAKEANALGKDIVNQIRRNIFESESNVITF